MRVTVDMGNCYEFSAATARWTEAVEIIDKWLTASASGVSRLNKDTLALYHTRDVCCGWRIPIGFATGERRFDILVGSSFPFEGPRLALVDRPPYLTWPHIEADGCICLLPGGATISSNDPVAVLKHLLDEAVRWLETSEAGTNIEDFRAEFLSYWSPDADAPLVRSLVEPHGPSRAIVVNRFKGLYVLAESVAALSMWLDHARLGKTLKDREIDPALFVWLDQPMLPDEFPATPTDIVARVRAAGLEGQLTRLGAQQLQRIVVLFGAPTSNGPAFCATVLVISGQNQPRRGALRANNFERGFRPGHTPAEILAQRFLGAGRVRKAAVERMDPNWIHGRDADPYLPTLRASKVVVIGCGSLGAPIALGLAQAGVGSLNLIDPDILMASNVGRHPLGAAEVGFRKARALAERIRSNYPHIIRAEGHCEQWAATLARAPELLVGADLLISTIGDWGPEAALNAWRSEQKDRPDVLFGWTEPHAVAGHAVGLVRNQGCFACGMSAWGEPMLPVAAWPHGTGQRGEPACGVMYQPYGPVEAAHVAAVITEAALDILLRRSDAPFHRIWVARESVLMRAGGAWSEPWRDFVGGSPEGGCILERPWPAEAGCYVCTTVQA
ncbi:E2/UBC family protein [Methylobacterium sp. Gmos1]